MKRPHCKTCKHPMKGHRKKQCRAQKVLFIDGCTYSGSVYNDKPSGRGRLSSEELVYEGEWRNGLRHGYGTETCTNGEKYVGQWNEGKYHGHGELIKSNGSKYNGEFLRGKFHGKGIYKNNDIIYDGQWYHGSRHGQGVLTNAQGTYTGQFYYQLRHGQGSYTDIHGNNYKGQWSRGTRHGQGVYTSMDGSYTGAWRQDKRHGHGISVCVYKGVYSGQWKNDKRHGTGTHTYVNGSTYDGGWYKGQRTGHGVLTWKNGEMYDGTWVRNEREGRGTYTDEFGIKYIGMWKTNKREGFFKEIHRNGYELNGIWVDDKRHGTFINSQKQRLLFIWDKQTSFETPVEARRTLRNFLKQNDELGAMAIVRFDTSILTWTFLNKYDKRGILLEFETTQNAMLYFKKYAWRLFLKKRYTFLENLVARMTPEKIEHLSDTVPELFDALSHDFVANPWIVRDQSYSKQTRQRLLDGLHLGDFGRCPPRDPFTRGILKKSSGHFLHTKKENAKSIYNRAKVCVQTEPNIQDIALTLDIKDIQTLLNNATEANDTATIRRLLKERDALIHSRHSRHSGEYNS